MQAPAPATEFDGGAIGNVVDRHLLGPSSRRSWRTVELCGRGGLAEVWRATAPDGRKAALKRLRGDLAHRERFAPALRREYAWLRSLALPGLVAPLELVETEAGPDLVLEYLPNGDLVSLLGAPPRHWLPAMRSVAATVAGLHERGVAHGDLKARNVLFAVDESARLIDLTSARTVDAPAVRTTAAYALPPETEATARDADCFALAVLIFELVTGQLPYGERGCVDPADCRPVARPVQRAGARLLDAAGAVLGAPGRPPQGLSYLADVIESVGATGA